MLHFFLNHLHYPQLWIKLSFCYCEHRPRETGRNRDMTKLKHQQQKLNVIIPTVSESPCLQLVALAHLYKPSSYVYSFGVATLKAVCAVHPRPIRHSLQICLSLYLRLYATQIFNWQQLFFVSCNAWEGQENSTSTLFNCQCRLKIKRNLVMYSPHNPFLLWRQEHESPLQRLPWLFRVCLLITNRDTLGGWICTPHSVLQLIQGRLISTFLTSSHWRSDVLTQDSIGVEDI